MKTEELIIELIMQDLRYMEYMKEVKFLPFSYYGDLLKPLAISCYKGLVSRVKELEENPSIKYGEAGGYNRMER